MLIDLLSTLNRGPACFADLQATLDMVLRSFRYGSSGLIARVFRPRINTLLFAASKADHVAHNQHNNLRLLLERLVADAAARARFEGITPTFAAIAAHRSTDVVRTEYHGQVLSCVRGRLKDDDRETVLFPGEIRPSCRARRTGRPAAFGFAISRRGASGWTARDRPAHPPRSGARDLDRRPAAMTERSPVAPFELDPERADRLELVPPDAPPPPVLVEPAAVVPQSRRPWLRLFFGAGIVLLVGWLGLEAYDFVAGLFARSPLLGVGFAVVLALVALGAIGALGRELADLRRLERAERLRLTGERLIASEVHGQADAYVEQLERLYRNRADLAEPLARFRRQTSDALNDGEQLRLFSRTVLAPVDRQARRVVTRGARDIGALTALSPLGLLDGAIVLWRTLAMLRTIARLYGVRPGPVASIRLLRRTLGTCSPRASASW